jgi:hypothetical protein
VIPCPKCNAAMPDTARFCGSCGAALTDPLVPPPTTNVSAGPAPAVQVTSDNQIVVALDQRAAFDISVKSVGPSSGKLQWNVQGHVPPHSIKFRVVQGGWMPLKWSGDIQVLQAAPNQSSIRILVLPDWSSCVPLLFVCAPLALWALASQGWYFAGIIVIGAAWICWEFSSRAPAKIASDFLAKVKKAAT